MSVPTRPAVPIQTLSSPVQQAVSAHFSSRPRIENLVRSTLLIALHERYPTLSVDLASTRLATPREGGGWELLLLIDQVIGYLASGAVLEIGEIIRPHTYYFLADPQGNRLKLADGHEVDMKVIEALIKELPWRLPIEFKGALTEYWNQPVEDGVSRWRWLSNVLKDTLTMKVMQSTTLSDPELETVRQVLDYAQSEERISRYGGHATRVYYLQSTLTYPGRTESLVTPHLLLVRYPQEQAMRPLVMLCMPDGSIETFSSVESASQSKARVAEALYAVDSITTKRYEIDGDAFDTQAGLILGKQLSNLSELKLPTSLGLETLKATCLQITDASRFFLNASAHSADALRRVQTKLPQWLTKASSSDQAHYRSWSLALASAKKSAQGLSYLSGIPDIHSFVVTSLKQQLLLDQPRFEQPVQYVAALAACEPDDVELTFLLVSGTLAPGTTNVSGLTERVKMTLTELALKNLSGKPQGELIKVEHRDGLPLPAWFTAAYITQGNGLIEAVDIGKNYPEKLKAYLLDDRALSADREKRFSEQLRWQLPLQALELSLKAESGMTPLGASYVAAIMQADAYNRSVDGQTIVMRTLALLSSAEAKPDVVSNMFIIEPLNLDAGPHVLYRPLYEHSLQAFTSRTALMEAIATPSELQTSVLTWLTDSARTMYDNGGFKEPHFVRFNLEDDFPVATFEKPEPATLAVNGVGSDLAQHLGNGQLLPYLYQINALALVHQADRDTVSNRESRWRLFLEGANLFFNIFMLPYLRGPVMLTAWFLLLVQALARDVPALSSDDAVTRELAVVDLLQNLAMALLLVGAKPSPPLASPQARSTPLLRRAPIPRRISKAWPPLPPAIVKDGIVFMPGEWQTKAIEDLDFSFASANNRLTPDLRKKLVTLAVPKPQALPLPKRSDALAGLYLTEGGGYALIEGSYYPVEIEAGEVSIVGGPALQADAQGRWTVDLKMRLSGGAPSKQVKALRERNAQRGITLRDELAAQGAAYDKLKTKIEVYEKLVKALEGDSRRTVDEVFDQRQKYVAEMMSGIKSVESMMGVIKEIKELNVDIPKQVMLGYLEEVVEFLNTCLQQGDKIRQVMIAKWQAAGLSHIGPSVSEMDVYSANLTLYRERMNANLKVNTQAIEWLEKLKRYVDDMAECGPQGRERSEQLREVLAGRVLTPLHVKQVQVMEFEGISLKIFNNDLALALRKIAAPLREQIQTHDQLNKLDFSPRERLDVLNSLVEQYGHVLDGLLGFRTVHAEEVDAEAFQAFVDLVAGVYKEAEQQLANELEPLKKLSAKRKDKKQSLSSRPQKRIFNTRNKGRLIGDLKPQQSGVTGEEVEVRTDQDNELLSTYIKKGDEWDLVSVARSDAPIPPSRKLPEIKKEALKLYDMADIHLRRSESLINSARYPQEAEETLLHVAERLSKCASELEEASRADTESWRQREDLELVGGMRARAKDMSTKAHDLRVRLSLKLPPTHGTLQFLLEKRLVSITLNRKRSKLKRDFIDEYAIKDAAGNFIWCAHFHYKDATTPKADYAVAHLKLWSQRTSDYWSLKEKAKNQHEVVEVHRGQIGKNLAEQWFLPLTT